MNQGDLSIAAERIAWNEVFLPSRGLLAVFSGTHVIVATESRGKMLGGGIAQLL